MTPAPNDSGYARQTRPMEHSSSQPNVGVAIDVKALTHTYPSRARRTFRGRHETPRVALDAVSLQVQSGEIFGLLGPNGSGKSTLFRILSTSLKPTTASDSIGPGTARILGRDVVLESSRVRHVIGVVFQNPSLDRKLTVRENLMHQAHLYGIHGERLKTRLSDVLQRVSLTDRSNDLVEHLSGGLQRRVELAKAFLHEPRILLLDEPSTGLDPRARLEFTEYLTRLRDQTGITALLTTHILNEAERCDRIAILDRGRIVAAGSPSELRQEIGGDVIAVSTKNPDALRDRIHERFGIESLVVDTVVRIERNNGHEFIPQLVEAFPGQVDAVTVSKPTLEDVFIRKTGHRFWEDEGGTEKRDGD